MWGLWWKTAGAAGEGFTAALLTMPLLWLRQIAPAAQVAEIMLMVGLGVPLTCITLYWLIAAFRGGQHLRLHLLLRLHHSGSYGPLLRAALEAERGEEEDRRLALVRFVRALDPCDVADAALNVAGPAASAARAAESVRQKCRAQQELADGAAGSPGEPGEACVVGIVLSQPDETNLGSPGAAASLREQTLSVLTSLGEHPAPGSEYRFYCVPAPGSGMPPSRAQRLFSRLRETL